MGYTPFVGRFQNDPPQLKLIRTLWRLEGPRTVVTAGLFEHCAGAELRVWRGENEDDVVRTEVARADGDVLAHAEGLRLMLVERGWH